VLVVRLNGVDCLDIRLLFEFAFFLLYQYVNALYCQLLKLQLQHKYGLMHDIANFSISSCSD
jgi:hypothetical protein